MKNSSEFTGGAQSLPRSAEEGATAGPPAISGISCIHFLNDLHPTFLPTLMPEIVKRLSLSLGEAGFASTLFGVMNLIFQPVAGALADRLGGSAFVIYSPLFTAAGAYLLPIAPTFGILLIFVSIMGIGTASFHPQAHGLTGKFGGAGRLGLYIAIFSSAGTLGAALSPLYAVSLLRMAGPSLMPLALIPLFILIMLMKKIIAKEINIRNPKPKAPGRSESGTVKPREKFFSGMFRVLLICMPLMLVSIIRDSSSQGIRVFLPLLVTDRGGSMEMGGIALFSFTIAGSIANIFGGRLSDKFGKVRIITLMLTLAPVFLIPGILIKGMTSLVFFTLGGACIAATNPITLAMAQEQIPESRSTASSLVMGVAWGIANIVAYPIGMLADRVGLTKTLIVVAISPLVVAVAFIVNNSSIWRRKKG
ncbi:MAG: MFS transporter [Synergistaceae bacterium]|nr:MFS transporter [Synergistaceae bacterium]